ncbi:MAG: hypothetical protein NZ736_05235 [Candidatus Poseidoniaceae archaeon]|nr:hypothetical protein [Candidatus Poseidoniaceae archaeon]
MSAPPIITDFSVEALVPLLFAMSAALLFWNRIVPRQLRGLQVAFETGEKRYEVHRVTTSFQDAKDLLASKYMRFGVSSYLFALTGTLLLFFEYLMIRFDIYSGYHAQTLALALLMITWPAVVSSGASLGAQVIKPLGNSRATLQDSSIWRTYSYLLLTILWFGIVAVVALLLDINNISSNRIFSIAAFAAFAPAVLAYGRILGSSWQALHQSSKKIASGEPSPFHNHIPSTRQIAIASIVKWNLIAMPFVAINTVISLLVLAYDPTLFVHSDKVLELPEYRVQSTIMEEGGMLGFGLIELFSNIPQAGIRVPMVTSVLLFLLLNVALIGFLFVYEVARILFLDIQDVSGRGGIKLADSRLLRAEISVQAKVLNFCFTGFAGQSMLLLSLAMITFWDSSFLPQGEACGTWENSVCGILTKDGLEELTWMLAAGGQVSFLFVWAGSINRGSKLEDINFDASMSENREMLTQLEDKIYLKQTPLSQLIADDEWDKLFKQLDVILAGHGEDLEGLDLVRRISAKMTVFCSLGRWDEAEEEAISLLALRGGREAQIARTMLTAASLAQRDLDEAKPRLAFLPEDDIEGARLQWFASVLSPKSRKLAPELHSLLAVDPLTKRNMDLIKRMSTGESVSKLKPRDNPAGRMQFLGDIARLRMEGQFERAINLLEQFIADNNIKKWPHGNLVRALISHDEGRIHTAADSTEKLFDANTRHPHIRTFVRYLATIGHTDYSLPEETGMEWCIDSGLDWVSAWTKMHNVAPAPELKNKNLKKHAWQANAWIAHDVGDGLQIALAKKSKGWKTLKDGDSYLPVCLYTHLTGIVVTMGGMPVDLGLPGNLDLQAIKANGLIDL